MERSGIGELKFLRYLRFLREIKNEFSTFNFQFSTRMKKYTKPEIMIVKLQQMQMLCSSDAPVPEYHDEIGASTQFTRESDFLEDW